ncbi:hypothetical protein V2J09_019455 [Rumex salicifolius]
MLLLVFDGTLVEDAPKNIFFGSFKEDTLAERFLEAEDLLLDFWGFFDFAISNIFQALSTSYEHSLDFLEEKLMDPLLSAFQFSHFLQTLEPCPGALPTFWHDRPERALAVDNCCCSCGGNKEKSLLTSGSGSPGSLTIFHLSAFLAKPITFGDGTTKARTYLITNWDENIAVSNEAPILSHPSNFTEASLAQRTSGLNLRPLDNTNKAKVVIAAINASPNGLSFFRQTNSTTPRLCIGIVFVVVSKGAEGSSIGALPLEEGEIGKGVWGHLEVCESGEDCKDAGELVSIVWMSFDCFFEVNANPRKGRTGGGVNEIRNILTTEFTGNPTTTIEPFLPLPSTHPSPRLLSPA